MVKSIVEKTESARHFSIDCLLINGKYLIPRDRNTHIVFLGRIIDNIKQKKDSDALKWPDFYRIRNAFCDMRHSYAMTSYKSQGSTFDDVFVDSKDIRSIPKASQTMINQHLYTALSRARHNAVILTWGLIMNSLVLWRLWTSDSLDAAPSPATIIT